MSGRLKYRSKTRKFPNFTIKKSPEFAASIVRAIANLKASQLYIDLNETNTDNIDKLLKNIEKDHLGYDYNDKDLIRYLIYKAIRSTDGEPTIEDGEPTIEDAEKTQQFLKLLYQDSKFPEPLSDSDDDIDDKD